MDRLENGVALIVGASSGIGRRAALVLAQAGWPVVLAARRTDLLEALGAELNGLGHAFATVRIDVTDTKSLDEAVAWTEQSVGPIQMLFNGAGIGLAGNLTDTNADAFESVWRTNTLGAFLVATAVGRCMMKRSEGRPVKPFASIINVA